jgi:pimeloyl-ACP methyl ester carboxylesterase
VTGILRFDDWTDPVRPVKREVISKLPEDGGDNPPVLFVPGPGQAAQAFAEHWLPHAAERGFAAHALTPRDGGGLREHVHDVVQTAASLPRQVVLVGHGTGALVVAHALGRYPARAAVLAAPVLDRWATLGMALRVNPAGALPALFGGRLRLSRRQLVSSAVPAEQAQAYGRSGRLLSSRKKLPDPVGDPPALVVGSPDDRVVPRKSLDRTAARLGGAPLLFPGMGHDLMLDAAWTDPIEAILDWLTKELPSAG